MLYLNIEGVEDLDIEVDVKKALGSSCCSSFLTEQFTVLNYFLQNNIGDARIHVCKIAVCIM